MPSNYLLGVEGTVYSLSAPPPNGLSEQASSIIDAQLKRPEGLAYVTDKNGTPIYMAASVATTVFKLGGAIAAGSNVTVTVTPAMITPYMVGEVLILEPGTPNQEACVIASVVVPGTVTFATVINAHISGSVACAGLVITEERSLPAKRSVTRVAKWPVVNVLSVLGRYGYGRRSDQIGGLYQEMNLLASAQVFGGPAQWTPVSVANVDWSGASQTGEVWIPAGVLAAYYSDVRIKYVAGFPTSNVPDCIVRATAAVANAIVANGGIGGQIKSMTAGGSKIERFFASSVDEDTRRQLAPYAARTFF
jgi:hypothetical protein